MAAPTIDSGRDLEADLVRRFAFGLAEHGLEIAPGVRHLAFIAGHEVVLAGAGTHGNAGAADLLMVTEDGRWWIVEAKLARNSECQPNFLFGNQLARYATAMEALGLSGLHPRLESYLYGRRSVLRPPEALLERIERTRDLTSALAVWCADLGAPEPEREARRLTAMLDRQLRQRTITLAALVDVPGQPLRDWATENRGTRSLAVLTLDDGRPHVHCDGTCALDLADGIEPPSAPVLPPFDQIPQSYRPTPRTLPRVLSPAAYALYRDVLQPRLAGWTDGRWPDVPLSVVTSAAFSLDLQSEAGREICLQVGRANLAGGGSAGAHPRKLIVNLIWAAERGHEIWSDDREAGEAGYADLKRLVGRLCAEGGMLVRGVSRQIEHLGDGWWARVRAKMRGDEHRRAELVAVREAGAREGYGWPENDPTEDRRLLEHALDAVEAWLGAPPYAPASRRETARTVPGAVRQ